MDPIIKMVFEEVIRRFDAFNSKWEAKFVDAESMRRDRDAETDRHIAVLESFSRSVPRVVAHLTALEDYCSA
jgi:hypothetical protein